MVVIGVRGIQRMLSAVTGSAIIVEEPSDELVETLGDEIPRGGIY